MVIIRRIIWIDWAKSICMFLVVFGHCHIQSSLQLITQVIYSFHIPLFFFISGLLCSKSFSKRTLLKDLNSIILPYFIFGIFQIIIHSFLSRVFSFHFILISIRSILIGEDASIGAIWFLPALFICKQLYYFLKRIGQKSILSHTIIFILSLLPAYYISLYKINLPLFADSALFGLPFFFIGNYSTSYIDGNSFNNTIHTLLITIVLLLLTIILSIHNGFVSIATCNYGNYLLIYYINALIGIGAIIGVSLLLRNFHYYFITTTSYGTIVTLGIHGSILLLLHYYIPIYVGYYTPTVSLPIAIIYTSITNITCYFIIIWGDHYCPRLLGLKGNLPQSMSSGIRKSLHDNLT